MNIDLTIFTPTYNRAGTLTRLYDSLKNQTLKNFEWLIVDDGSEDDTRELINKFINENIISINYVWQNNQGKQAAWNNALIVAKGRYFCGVDSDDALYSNYSINDIFEKYISLINDNVMGLRFLAYSNVKNRYDGIEISPKIKICSYYEEFSNSSIFGERIDVFKTDIIRKFHYPVTNDIKFIPEIWFYVKSAELGYKFAYIPAALRMFYDDNQVNRLSMSSIKKHSKGHYISRAAMLRSIPFKIFIRNPKAFLITICRFSQCANYSNVSFSKRVNDVGLIYSIFSIFLIFIKLK